MATEWLEAVMLICFGISWPVSLLRNVRARTARSMSLGFILLITAGYLAGIAAKIMSGGVGFVLIVYVINLIAVLLNLAVFFINRSYDRAAAMSGFHE